MGRSYWTPGEELYLRMVYPSTRTSDLAVLFGRTERSIYTKARDIGLSKSAEYLASPAACRLRRGYHLGHEHRFKPGQKPWNAGRKGWRAGGRSAETQFKAGERRGAAARNWQPIGSERRDADGYLQRKVTDTGYPPRDWRGVHVLAWETRNGTVPPGHAVVFRNGDKDDIRDENLELVSRAELMRRNSIHRYPAELKHAIRLVKKLNRTIEERA